MSRRTLTRAALGLAVSGGVLLLAAGPAMANDSSRGPDGAGGGSSDFTGHEPSPANDLTPGGVPLFGLVDSVQSAPKKVLPDAAGPGY
ncbi:hypothetical protein [Pseudonocardia sp.]|uniref:hypothetical protein n=1 Tax=Pseudonocardia sp. TaxID=60912 RepID=UPI003D0FFBEA